MSDIRKNLITADIDDNQLSNIRDFFASHNDGVGREGMHQYLGEPSEEAKKIIDKFGDGSDPIYIELKEGFILRRTGSEIYWYRALYKGMPNPVAYYRDRPINIVEYKKD